MTLSLTCPTCDYNFEVEAKWFSDNTRICCMNCSKAWQPSFTFHEQDMIKKSKEPTKENVIQKNEDLEIDRWNTDFDFDLKKEDYTRDTQKAVEMATDDMFNAFEKIFYDTKNTATVRRTNIISYKNWCRKSRIS